jgi:putative peptide maturation system protein
MHEAIQFLDFIWGEAPIMRRLVDSCLIRDELDREPIELSDAELQRAMDEFRKKHQLFRAEDTDRWMTLHGMTHEGLETYLADEATIAKLRDRIANGRVEDYFEEHRVELDTAYVAQLQFVSREDAREVCDRMRSSVVDFYEAAGRRFLAIARSPGHSPLNLFAAIPRRQASAELEMALFSCSPGEVIGPLRDGDRYTIIRALSIVPARLDDRMRATIKQILFEEWLAERRREARIEWYWGESNRTSPSIAVCA